MKRLWLSLLLGLIAIPAPGGTEIRGQLSHRSVSHSHQFYTYCRDTRLRLAVNSFVETAKNTVLRTLGESDHWKFPIVINMQPASTLAPNQSLSDVRLMRTEEGPKIAVTLTLKQDEFRDANFPQQIIRSVLLEYMYRNDPPEGGASYFEAPAWIVEGINGRLQAQSGSGNSHAALFKQLIETGRLPRVGSFLGSDVAAMDTTSRAIYSASCASLIDMLTELPMGQKSLAAFLRDHAKTGADPVALLLKHFPTLGGSETALEKWWTLGLARVSSSDRHLALDIKESNTRLESVLGLTIATDKAGREKREFALTEYKEFLKLPGAKAALRQQQGELTALQPNIHPLLYPVVVEYQRLNSELLNNKTRKIEEPLQTINNYRTVMVERMGKIIDYMNWFEATQMPEWSGAFDNYLRTAKAVEQAETPKRSDPITRYIDQVEQEFN